ncbi:MAG: hypothetical protein ABIL58_20855 [Pseudomonadota bacterium]
MTIPGIGQEPRARTAREDLHDAGERQPRKRLNYIIDPYMDWAADAAPAEPAQIYDRRSSAVLLGPPSVGQLLNIYA